MSTEKAQKVATALVARCSHMEITFVLASLGPAGGNRANLSLANELSKRGHKVKIISPIFPIPLKKREFLGRVKTALYRLLFHKYETRWMPTEIKGLNIERPLFLNAGMIGRTDVLIATFWFVAKALEDFRGPKFYIIGEISETQEYREVLQSGRFLLITVSSTVKKYLEEKFSIKILGVVKNAVDTKIFYRENYRTEDNITTIGMLYSPAVWKGSKYGFEAFEIVKERFSKIHLQLKLFGLTKKGIPKYAIFCKNPSPDELRKIYNSIDIIVMPSLVELFPLIPLEAMACGVPGVYTDVGGIREMVDDMREGIIVPKGNSEAIADAVSLLIGNKELREQMSKNSLEKVKNFTWQKSAAELERIIRENI